MRRACMGMQIGLRGDEPGETKQGGGNHGGNTWSSQNKIESAVSALVAVVAPKIFKISR